MLEMTSSLVTEVAPGVHHISLLGSSWINAYLIGDILIDAGIRASAPKLARVLSRRPIRAHALTHVHDDHQGSSRFVCSQFGVPLWVHTTEADLMTNNRMRENVPRNLVTAAQSRFWGGDPYPVSRGLTGGGRPERFRSAGNPWAFSRTHLAVARIGSRSDRRRRVDEHEYRHDSRGFARTAVDLHIGQGAKPRTDSSLGETRACPESVRARSSVARPGSHRAIRGDATKCLNLHSSRARRLETPRSAIQHGRAYFAAT
jgi:Metallo-beta-lactamase superfamily